MQDVPHYLNHLSYEKITLFPDFYCLSLYHLGTKPSRFSLVQIQAEDALGQKDTILLGNLHYLAASNSNVTLGVDSSYGEQNIYGQPLQSLDMRTIQRDSFNHHCIRKDHYVFPASEDLYFPHNIDSKIDFRPEFLALDRKNSSFEVFIHADHYPVTLTLLDSYFANTHFYFNFLLLDSSCTLEQFRLFHTGTPFVLSQSHQNTLIVDSYSMINTNKIPAIASIIKIFPNPVKEQLFVEGLEELEGELVVVNSLGQVILQRSVAKENLQLEVSGFSQGIYFIHCYDEYGRLIDSQQFVK